MNGFKPSLMLLIAAAVSVSACGGGGSGGNGSGAGIAAALCDIFFVPGSQSSVNGDCFDAGCSVNNSGNIFDGDFGTAAFYGQGANGTSATFSGTRAGGALGSNAVASATSAGVVLRHGGFSDLEITVATTLQGVQQQSATGTSRNGARLFSCTGTCSSSVNGDLSYFGVAQATNFDGINVTVGGQGQGGAIDLFELCIVE